MTGATQPPPVSQPELDRALLECPYVGLVPFDESDALYFFGRQRECDDIVANLTTCRLTLLYAASGVGKSSVLRAGVLPRLQQIARESYEDLGVPNAAVAYIREWSLAPLDTIATAVLDAVSRVPGAGPVEVPGPPRLSVPWLREVLQRSGVATVYLVLDQFEEYFLYHPDDRGDDGLAGELGRILSTRDLQVNVLLSIREDAFAALDRFKGRVPRLFDNYLRLAHLGRNAAREAIKGPLDRYNQVVPPDSAMAIEPELTEALLDQVRTGHVVVAPEGVASGGAADGREDIETPYLQLVLTKLWDAERASGSSVLRLGTLDEMGGAQTIVQTHLQTVMDGLSPEQREVAAEVFRYLVTPSGSKIALTAEDLAGLSGVPVRSVRELLQSLSAGRQSILRTVPPPAGVAGPPRYEIFHDVIGAAVLDWRRQYVAQAEASRKLAAEREAVTTLGMTGDPAEPPIVEPDDEARAFLFPAGWRRRRRTWQSDVADPPAEAVADPPDEAVADLPDEAVTDPLLPAAVEGIDQHSGVVSDVESAEDQLRITDDVRSIARMLAALNTTPPLSIALLGDWGSGKSTFMRQVIERVDALATASKPNPRGSAYAANVRQPRFNAWHYSDDHLWGGLVEHLFLELGDRRRDPNEDQRDNVQDELATEQAKLRKLTEDLRAVDALAVDAGWLGWLHHPFRVARVLRAVGKSLRDEIRAPKRLLVGLGLILLGAVLVVCFALLGHAVIGWVAGAITVVSGLLSPAVLAWRHVETFTKEARTKLQDGKKESEDSIRSLEGRLDLIDPARRLESLLSAISSTDRYERYRGLTGRIRHDLDQLSRDLAAAQQRWATDDTGVPPPLQRIILYVDDLDRCTSSRVVEVLQAVNLLLSMPLFVVVVAVDPRWLLLALEEHHGRLLGGGHHTRLAERRVRSLDYLDKIFHIPYAVRPMSHQGADYLRSLLPPVDESERHPRVEEADRDSSPPPQVSAIASDFDRGRGREEAATQYQGVTGDEGVAANQEVAAEQVAADQVTANQEVAAEQVAADQVSGDLASAVQEVVADRDVAGDEASAIVQPEAIDLTGRGLRLQKAERDFLPLLAPLLPTPRAVKKLTNLYRLTRIGVPKDQLDQFVGGDDGGPYQAVALLLAAVVGAPAQAESFLLALSSAAADAGRDIVDVLADLGEPPFANLLAERIRLIRKTLPVHGDVETYQKSVKAVARYSFETYHLFSGD